MTMHNTMTIDGYRAVITFDPDIQMFRGEFLGLNGGADFYAKDVKGLQREGKISLKVFLDACAEDGVEPRRVAERVAHGGHSIPTQAIERRFARSLRNLFELYAHRVSLTRCYLNSLDDPALVFTQQGNRVEIFNDAIYRHPRCEAGL